MNLTANDDLTLERMLNARDGQVGAHCKREVKYQGEDQYQGPGTEPVKSSVSLKSAAHKTCMYHL